MIADMEPWIFYEGDGFMLGHNPYVFPNESVVDVRSEKPALIGPGMRERMFAMLGFHKNQRIWEKDQTVDRTPTEKFYKLMAKDIEKERKRVGGDWIPSGPVGLIPGPLGDDKALAMYGGEGGDRSAPVGA